MAQKKKISNKKTKNNETNNSAEQENELETSDDAVDIEGPKAKKGVDIESALEPAAIIDEKADDDLPVSVDDEDSSGEELSLDDDELNPFGDKWEQ